MVNQIIKTKLFYMFLISQTIFFNINSFLFDFSDHSLDPVCLNLSRKNFENTNDCWNTIQQVAIEKGIQLEDVTELCIQNTNLTELPHEIGQLTNLKRLDLPNNSLEILPEEITNLQELCYLNLTNNNFNIFPTQIISLTRLILLNLDKNNIQILPDIKNLQTLNTLRLIDNPLQAFPISSIQRMRKLRNIFITINGINYDKDGLFDLVLNINSRRRHRKIQPLAPINPLMIISTEAQNESMPREYDATHTEE